MKLFLLFPLLACLCLAVACGHSQDDESGIESFHNMVPVENYLSLFPYDNTSDSDTSDKYDFTFPSKDKYVSLVRKAKGDGLETLNENDRQAIIFLSWLGYVLQAETIRYRVSDSASNREGVLEEIYESQDLDGFSSPYLIALHSGPGSPYNTGWIGEDAESIMLTEPGFWDEGSDAGIITWIKDSNIWSCSLERGNENRELALAFTSALRVTLDPALVRGKIMAREEVNGRLAYKITATLVPGKKPYSSMMPTSLWLDAETLLPLQYEQTEFDLATGQETGRKLLFTIEEVNGELDIEPPNADVQCVEKSGD